MITFLIFNYGNICYCLGEGLEFSLSSKGVMGISAYYYYFLNNVHNRVVKHTVFGCGAPYICSSVQFIDFFTVIPCFLNVPP